ncbi:UNVERIFIED_CONTAM: hemerythrin [Acetivibrio alkalicellulosi]
MAIEWRKSYETGIEEIDTQHKELFKRIGDLLDACSQHKGKIEVNNTIEFLGEYVITHFTEEESLQLKHSYPEYKAHKLLHDNFIVEFNKLKNRLESDGATLQFVALVNRVVVEWLINHIGNADKNFGKYVKREIV